MSQLNISQSTIEKLSKLSSIPKEWQRSILSYAILLMEGNEDEALVTNIVAATRLVSADVLDISQAGADIYWEFARGVVKNENVLLGDILTQIRLPADVIPSVIQVFMDNKQRINDLKNAFHIKYPRYKDLAWRLDIELGRRNLRTLAEPKFMLRLDVSDPSQSVPNTTASTASPTATKDSSVASSGSVSHHLECDYSNLRRLQAKLQQALDEVESTHSQRIMRYIS